MSERRFISFRALIVPSAASTVPRSRSFRLCQAGYRQAERLLNAVAECGGMYSTQTPLRCPSADRLTLSVVEGLVY